MWHFPADWKKIDRRHRVYQTAGHCDVSRDKRSENRETDDSSKEGQPGSAQRKTKRNYQKQKTIPAAMIAQIKFRSQNPEVFRSVIRFALIHAATPIPSHGMIETISL